MNETVAAVLAAGRKVDAPVLRQAPNETLIQIVNEMSDRLEAGDLSVLSNRLHVGAYAELEHRAAGLGCDCEPGAHWTENAYGTEHRIACTCPCDACAEF